MFDTIAPRYDLLNRLLSFGLDKGWRRALARSIPLETAGIKRSIVDCATGTGDLLFSIKERLKYNVYI